MKRVIDEKTLKALYPPMETAFETQMRQTLRSLPVERRHRGARRKPAAVLVAAARAAGGNGAGHCGTQRIFYRSNGAAVK